VICYDYNVTDKLSERSFEARIIGYTLTHEIYQVIDKNGKQRVSNSDVHEPEPELGLEPVRFAKLPDALQSYNVYTVQCRWKVRLVVFEPGG
jgi:hypothetical protein